MVCYTQVHYADCCEIVAACKSAGVTLAVCHVLRYTPQARKIAELIQTGSIGDVINIQHTEPVSMLLNTTSFFSVPVFIAGVKIFYITYTWNLLLVDV